MTIQRGSLLLVGLLGAVFVACEPSVEALPRLDDPHEIPGQAIRTTSEIEFVHLRLEANLGGAADAQRYVIEGDLNLPTREFHAVADLAGLAGTTQRGELLLVGTDVFTRTEGDAMFGNPADGRWVRQPIDAASDPRNGLPATPAIALAIKTLLDDPGVAVTLVGIEPCGDRQCYQLTVTIPPEVTWLALSGGLLGGDPDSENAGAPDPSIPAIELEVMVDEATRNLAAMSTTIDSGGQTIQLAATLSNHDVEFALLPPPPDQVIDQSELDNSGGGVGPGRLSPAVELEEVTPAPMVAP